MGISIGIMALAAIIVVAVMIVTIIYGVLYKRRANIAITTGNPSKRPMVGLPKVFSSLLFVALIVFVLFVLIGQKKGTVIEPTNTFRRFTASEISGTYLEQYQLDENAGYLRREETRGNITFICFVSKDELDDYHPQFLLFVKFNGDASNLYLGEETKLLKDGKEEFGIGTVGSDDFNKEPYLLYVGDLDLEHQMRLDLYFYKNDGLDGLAKRDLEEGLNSESLATEFASYTVTAIR